MKIKELILKENYINCTIVGHSSDNDENIKKAFTSSGAEYFLTKPSI